MDVETIITLADCGNEHMIQRGRKRGRGRGDQAKERNTVIGQSSFQSKHPAQHPPSY
jgi:hypothetical protein